jgi:eukaryotic-like serine/threonine-protein kinase
VSDVLGMAETRAHRASAIPISAPATAPANAQPPTQLASTEATLHALEAVRARVFFRAMLAIDLVVMAALPILPGLPWLKLLTGLFTLWAAIICVTTLILARDERRYTPRVALVSGVLLSLLAIGVIYYLGLFSASATLFTVGIYFFGSSRYRSVARTVYGTTAISYFIATLLIAIEILPDLSVFPATHLDLRPRIYRVVMEQVVFAMTFYLARSGRRATEAALEKIRSADVILEKQTAQLDEARGELDRALLAGEGRLTGQTVGKYQLGRILGRGGMGEVYAATHVGTNAEVAVKLLHPTIAQNEEHVARFLREAHATAQVPNEHVAQVFDVGQSDAGIPFIVMELLEGHDLGFYLRKSPQLDLPQVVEMVEQSALALAAVREAGVVHRDLKPANLFLTDTLPRKWKVLDFGLSKVFGMDALTRDNAVGTPSYMAPEQLREEEVDHLADLYALTAVAYRAITGRPPFSGDAIGQVLLDVLGTMPPNPSHIAKIPIEVELVLAIGLAKQRRDRFASIEELSRALRAAYEGRLDETTRKRGWAQLKKHPWGSTVSRRAA